MKTKFRIILVLILLNNVAYISAQIDTTAIYRITLNDDSELLGKIKSESDSLIFFITNAG